MKAWLPSVIIESETPGKESLPEISRGEVTGNCATGEKGQDGPLMIKE